jgi:hypothetical protein
MSDPPYSGVIHSGEVARYTGARATRASFRWRAPASLPSSSERPGEREAPEKNSG